MSSIKTITTLAAIVIISLGFIGCSGGDSIPLTGTTVDTAPPAVPAQLATQVDHGVLTLSWAANTTDDDLAGFVVEKEYLGQVFILQDTPVNNTSIQDNPGVGLNIYKIYSVDLVGNASAAASIQCVVEAEPTPRPSDEGSEYDMHN